MDDADGLIDRVLGGPRRFDSYEVSAAAGMTLDEARQYWRAMGFADVGESQAFTDEDLAALGMVRSLVTTGVLDQSEALEIVRSLGQNTARMANWQTGTLARLLASRGDIPDSDALKHEHVERLAELTTSLLPGLEELLVYAWRRQLAAALQRIMDLAHEDDADAGVMCVGFADIVGFTRLSRRLPDERLADLVMVFEADSADVVAGTGARLIKTLGDEVMFAAESVAVAVETSLRLHEVHRAGEDVPELRIGLAYGDVVTRMGDVYGSTVNRASRLTDLARPGSTLVDEAAAAELATDDHFALRALRGRPIRGLGLTRSYSVTRRRPAG